MFRFGTNLEAEGHAAAASRVPRGALKTLAIIGGGSWGTALACVLAPRFDRVRLWAHEPDLAGRIQTDPRQ